jgi:hypothetical protein
MASSGRTTLTARPGSLHDAKVTMESFTTHLLQRQQRIDRPLAEVFAFFTDATNLQAITPPWLSFKILTPLPLQMQQGTLIDYQIRLFGAPIRWRTVIDDRRLAAAAPVHRPATARPVC